jgi:RNA polymerase sigma-70 factor (ECF subfamily)
VRRPPPPPGPRPPPEAPEDREDRDDRTLVGRAVRRDPQAWAELYERFAGSLLGFFVHQLHDRPAAEDLTSEVFIEALRAADRFRGDLAGLRSWLFRIARNNLVDYLRKQRRSPTSSLEAAQEAGLAAVAPGADPADAAVAALEQARVLAAIEALSPDQREVILLRLSGGLTAPEIAPIVGKTPGAVKALQHRALAALTRALNPGGGVPPQPEAGQEGGPAGEGGPVPGRAR